MTESCSTPLLQNPFTNDGAKKLLDATEVLDAVTSSYFITNDQLQLIYCNTAFLNNLDIPNIKEVEGLRPGDILSCVNATKSEKGCGTTPKCQSCSFRQCILDALQKNEPVTTEATLSHINNKMVAYNIKATPFYLDGSQFVSISSIDITECKRKQLMESVFFHDLINLSGSLSGYLDVIKSFDAKEIASHLPMIKNIADQLLDEIVSQRQVVRAEQNRLEADVAEFTITGFLRELKNQTSFHPSFKNRILYIDFQQPKFTLYSDTRLLSRVLINMLKNAMESTKKGNTVTLSVKKENDKITFAVHNEEYIPTEIQEHIFSYGFSTKGSGRGIGAYGMRLLGENLLAGKVSFTSTPDEGTTFYLVIPVKHPNEPLPSFSSLL
ncbi:MAG: PAS domain-containing sensor histidine kinase [Bacteroidales bacterium]